MNARIAILLVVLIAACGKDGAKEIPCTDEEYWDHVNSECVPRLRDENSEDNADIPDMGEMPDEGGDGGSDMDEPDEGPSNIVNPSCDADNDGALSIECGGMDCDDANALRTPGGPEFCDEIDNDCDDVVNEGIMCQFYAHSGTALFAIDPFAKTARELGTDLPNLQDIDTHPNGTLLGVSFDGLYQYDQLRDYWFLVGEFGDDGPSDPNGMAIDLSGRTFVTSENEIWEIDIIDGSASLVGNLGGDYYSSGDCVVNKQDSLYMTSKNDNEDTDRLLLIDRNNGSATEVGPIGFTRVFALTAAWGKLYGLTDDGGQLIQIDTMTGEGMLLHEFQGERFFGAASTPSR